MDPATISLIFGGAKMAYEAIKSGIKVGKELQGMASDVAKLYGSVAKLTQLSAKPPKPKLFSGVSVEEMAMDIVVKRKQAEAWYHEVKNAFVAEYGLRGWEEVQREIVHIQKQQKAAQAAAQKEHEESMHQLKVLGMAGLLVVMLVIGMIVTISLSIK
ncbi:MAG: hypothetical protein AMJ56_00290 [Anaerolineae bacterium SG8_19]|nr:MAG: hypothetical protein AMJ56_00290 [Anaerolineae bacterium SG8_19]